MVLGEPIQHMLGALKYPKENKKFRKTFNLPETEALVACKYYLASEKSKEIFNRQIKRNWTSLSGLLGSRFLYDLINA